MYESQSKEVGAVGTVCLSTDPTRDESEVNDKALQPIIPMTDGDGEQEEALANIEEEASFEGITVWSHDVRPDEDDLFTRALDEAVAFASKVHSYDIPIGSKDRI